ncbi:MAG: hypothetical protein KC766_12910 [Myxococcales bacterium]|nr:hypothetical protein [Myxococcales bacterium]
MSDSDRQTRTTQPRIPSVAPQATEESTPPSMERVGPIRVSSSPPSRGSGPPASQRRSLAPRRVGGDDAAEPVSALFRLFKNGRIHRIDNATVVLAAEQATTALRRFAAVANRPARLTFMGDLVFVCGELLRAGRLVYDSARQLGSELQAAGINELAFGPGVSGHDLIQLVDAWNTAVQRRGELDDWNNPRIVVRRVPELAYVPVGLEGDDPASRALDLYGVSIAVMRAFYRDVAAGSNLLPKRVKRIAQRWVMSALSGEESFLHLTTLASAHRDVAGRVVHSALLVLAMARVITRDRRILGELAVMALLAEVGRVRAAGAVVTAASDAAELMSLEATSAAMIASGGWEPQAWLRTVGAFEVAWLEREDRLGKLYGGQAGALLSSRLLLVARAYLERVAPGSGRPGVSPPQALGELIRRPGLHPGIVRLLARALGILPTGTVVELEGGEWAIVSAPKATPAYHRPALRLVTDAEGNPQQVPVQVDLEQTSVSGIRRIVTSEEARFNLAQAFFGEG